jgi:hypothetical protein
MKWSGRNPDPASREACSSRAERAWNGVCWTAVVVGVAADVTWFGWMSAVRAFVPVTFAFWVFALCLLEDVHSRRRQLFEWSMFVGTASVAFVGLWTIVQGWAVVLALTLAACHPWVVSWALQDDAADTERARRAASMRTHPSALPPNTAAAAAGFSRPSRLSDDALRQCWEASWALLQRAKSLSEAVRIVDYRRACLDEIARRSPETFELWLEAGAPNADEPARQLPPTFKAESSS